MYIAVDFDGTVVKHDYPKVGETIEGAVETLKLLVKNNHRIILWTMRSGESLRDAVMWYIEQGIPLYGINTNPTQSEWTESPKAYAQLYIDDAALGCPIRIDDTHSRPYVDWVLVREMLKSSKII
jgi:hypothetical protein